MNRRQLLTGAAAATTAGLLPAAPSEPARMKLGCQSAPTSDQRLQFFARHGVEAICGYPDAFGGDDLSRLRERCERWNVSLDSIAPPFLESTHIDKTPRPAIPLGKSPERDRDI